MNGVKKICTLIFVIFLSGSAWSQSPNFNVDSLKEKIKPTIDSLKGFQKPSLPHSFDSLHEYTNLNRFKDSLKIITWADSMTMKVNTHFAKDQRYLSQKIDSLEHLKIPTARYQQKVDSLVGKKDALVAEINSKQKSLEQKVTHRYTEWEKSTRSKLKLDSMGIKAGVRIPGMKDLSKDIGKIPGVPRGQPNLGQQNISGSALPALNSKDFSDLGLSKDLAGVGGKTSLPSTSQLNQWEQNISGLTDPIKNVKGKLSEAGAMAKDPSKAAENAMGQIKEVNELNGQISKSGKLMKDNEALQLADKMKNPEAMQAEIKEKGFSQVVNHFAGQEEALKKSMDEVSKYKTKYKSLGSLSDAKKKWQPVNSLRDISFRERFHPGINFGLLNRKDTVSIDFYPNAAYQISGRFEVGAGAMYRVRVLEKTREVDQHNPVWGLNSFTTIRLFKSTRLRVELDGTSNPLPQDVEDASARVWRWRLVAGIQNNFRVSKSIEANVQMLYNFDKKLKDAFPDKILLRIGIQYRLTKKETQSPSR